MISKTTRSPRKWGALFVRANSLRDTPPGIGGLAKDAEGFSHAVYPPILVLARQSFFKPSATDDPPFEPGFYCLFAKPSSFEVIGGVSLVIFRLLANISSTLNATCSRLLS